MTEFANAMAVFKLLNKSNCRKCNETTCLAFASKVFLGAKPLDQCPALAPEVLAQYRTRGPREMPGEAEREKVLAELRACLAECDLEKAAQRTGGVFSNGWLTLRVLGKPFSLNRQAEIRTDIHVNPWVVMPAISYVLNSQGVPLTGKWVPYRELAGAREKNGLFVRMVEERLKGIADAYPGLFLELIDMFSAKPMADAEAAKNQIDSDVSLVLYPLPLLPMLVCYWKPDEGMDADFHLFFDSSTDQNGGSELVFSLTSGLVTMFEKFAATHGIPGE